MEKWRDNYEDEEELVFNTIKQIVKEIDPEPFKDGCPSEVIARVCDEFKIPRKQILFLS